MLLGKELAMDFKSTPLPAPPAPKMSAPSSDEAVVNPRDQLKLIEPLHIEPFFCNLCFNQIKKIQGIYGGIFESYLSVVPHVSKCGEAQGVSETANF